jgi:hypothetical protein
MIGAITAGRNVDCKPIIRYLGGGAPGRNSGETRNLQAVFFFNLGKITLEGGLPHALSSKGLGAARAKQGTYWYAILLHKERCAGEVKSCCTSKIRA